LVADGAEHQRAGARRQIETVLAFAVGEGAVGGAPTSTRAAGTGDASLALTTRPRTLSGVCAAPTAAGISDRRTRALAGRDRGPSPDERVIRPSEWCGKTVLLGGRTRRKSASPMPTCPGWRVGPRRVKFSQEAAHAPHSRPHTVPLVGDRGPERWLCRWGRWDRPDAVRQHRAGGG